MYLRSAVFYAITFSWPGSCSESCIQVLVSASWVSNYTQDTGVTKYFPQTGVPYKMLKESTVFWQGQRAFLYHSTELLRDSIRFYENQLGICGLPQLLEICTSSYHRWLVVVSKFLGSFFFFGSFYCSPVCLLMELLLSIVISMPNLLRSVTQTPQQSLGRADSVSCCPDLSPV